MTDEPTTSADGLAADFSTQLNQAFQSTALHRDLGVELSVNVDGIVLSGSIGPAFARGDGLDSLHGGSVATLLDSALTYAAIAQTRRLWSTVDLRVDYLRPARLGDVEVTATVLHAGASVARCRADMRDASGRLVAVGVATFVGDRQPDATQREGR